MIAIASLEGEALLDVEQVASLLNVPTSWVHNHTTRTLPLLPHYRFGKAKRAPVRFKRSEIEQFIQEHLAKPRVRR